MDYNIKWMNRSGIRESGMTKWIVTLHNSRGEEVKKIENDESENLKNFSPVTIKLSLTREEALKQTDTNNVIKVYFDDETDGTKLIQKNVSFNKDRLTLGIDDITFVKTKITPYPDMSSYYTMYLPTGIQLFDPSVADLPVREFTNFVYDTYLHTQPILAPEGHENIFLRSGDSVQGVIQMGESVGSPAVGIPYSKTKNYKIWMLFYRGNNFLQKFTYQIQDPFDVKYWKNVFFRQPPIARPPPLVKDEKFMCYKNDPIGNDSSNLYKYMGNGEYKWISDTETVDRVENCSDYTYTGKEIDTISTDGRCGPYFGNRRCPGNQCCGGTWCSGNKGSYGEWCGNKYQTSDNKYSTYIGNNPAYDGTDFTDMDVIIDGSGNSEVSANGRCGSANNGKRCPGNECCNSTGYCGGSNDFWSREYCSVTKIVDGGYWQYNWWTSRFNWIPYVYSYNGAYGWGKYDGRGEPKPTTTTEYRKLIDQDDIVLSCRMNDPLGRDNGTIYTWDKSSASLKKLASMPSNSTKFELYNCDGVRYAGPAGSAAGPTAAAA